jgi:sodium transport system permease protein
MRWSHVKLIFHREIRDQLRDRRTMFTVLFLPLLLYPLMGSVLFELAQFQKQNKFPIGIVGHESIPDDIDLIKSSESVGIEWKSLNRTEGLSCLFESPNLDRALKDRQSLDRELREQGVDTAVVIPPEFLSKRWSVPLVVVGNLNTERATVAMSLLDRSIKSEHHRWMVEQVAKSQPELAAIDAPKLDRIDTSNSSQKGVFLWSKVLPFVVLIWALTGAFYPAVDLCAGEKERGTLETLLSSPARRNEIVWGKLLTVICFSVGTALLNMMSMYMTGSLVMEKMASGGGEMAAALGPLRLHSLGWIVLLVIPISVMFSALALAVASLANSTKEGQYYLMPLMLVGMPLVSLPMLPGVSLSTGTSVVPVTGAVLLSRALIDGEYSLAILHIPMVCTITLLCTLLSVRWAVRQFESESAMLKDSMRFSLKNWLRDAWRQRESTPTVNESVLCGMIILSCLFFGRLMIGASQLSWTSIVTSTIAIQLGLILGPVLIMAAILTRSVPKALRINRVPVSYLAAAALLAIALHPTYTALASLISQEYKLGDETTAVLKQFNELLVTAPLGFVILVLALVPAISEELTFRGFLFAGLERNGGSLRAILLTSLLFGLSHGVLQQSISAAIMGVLLGWLAARSGSVLPTLVFHFVHNSVSMAISIHGSRGDDVPSWMSWAIANQGSVWAYTETWSTLSVAISIGLIALLSMQSRRNADPVVVARLETA